VIRPVDVAMAKDRADKRAIREIWVGVVADANDAAETADLPLYLTLPGAEGRDIIRLVETNILTLAENRAIAQKDLWKVVAVERSNGAALQLRRRFKGLKVVAQDIGGVLRSTGPLRWPEGEHERFCRARVVNLDLNSALRAERAENRTVFPTVQLVTKLAQLHLKPPALDWVLCLTVATQIDWPLDVCKTVQQFLRENFLVERKFADDSRAVLGDAVFDLLIGDEAVDFTSLSRAEQQSLLMVFVPKKIVADTYRQGWRIETTRNLRYGGQGGSARMATWVMEFQREPRVDGEPQAVYSESLSLALEVAGAVAPDGTVRQN
jgi:hypothetical protein